MPLDALDVRRAHRAGAALVRTVPSRLVAAAPVRGAAHRLGAAVVLEVRPLERPDAHELLVDLRRGDAGAVVEQRQQIAADEDMLLEGHGADLGDDDFGVAADRVEPIAELLGVGDGGRQRDEAHIRRQVDDDLFPHRAAEAVGEVVHLVHHDVAQTLQRRRPRVQHVAQHLGRHDDHPGVAVDVRVAGEQAHLVRAVHLDELPELLVRQGLHRRRVERLGRVRVGGGFAHRQMDRELPHDRLARTRGRGDQHTAAVLEGVASGDLEGVESEPSGMPRTRP